MKIGPVRSSALLVGAILVFGCGGPEQQEAPEVTQAPTAIDNDDSSPASEQEEWFPGRENAPGEGTVGELKACCFVRCSNNPAHWYGPYRNVEYGNCINYGKYFCAQRDWKYVGAKWDEC